MLFRHGLRSHLPWNLNLGPLFDCPMAQLFKLQQVGTVFEYYLKFLSIANSSLGLSDAALLSYFSSGLTKDSRREVLVQSLASII